MSNSCVCLFYTVEEAIRVGSETGELVDPDEPIHECDLHKALRERVAEMLDGEMKLSRRVEVAEARVAELDQALHRAHTAMDILIDRDRANIVLGTRMKR